MNLKRESTRRSLQEARPVGSVRSRESFREFSADDAAGSLAGLFERVAQRNPERLALSDARRKLTYAELNREANQLAHAIVAASAPGNAQVALLLETGLPMIVGFLAALKAGKLAVPLDASYPLARQAYMLKHSEAKLLVCDAATRARANELAGDDVSLLDAGAVNRRGTEENPDVSVSPEDLCYLLYTSGSTGEPKGIVHTHRNVLHNCRAYTNTLHITRDDRVSHLHSTSFSAGLIEVLWALLNGAAVCTWDVRARGFAGLLDWIDREGITILHWVPTSFRHMFKADPAAAGNGKGRRLKNVRLLVLGSEVVTRRDFELWKKHFTEESLFACRLGSTEVSNYRLFLADRQTEFEGTVVPVGYSFAGKEILLLDNDGRAVGTNEVGEISIRSEYLSPGYWRRPDLTAAAYLPDPEGGNKRIFRSGDLGILRPDGCLEYLGRKDSQVKIRGQRVEVAEIESALLEIPGVRQAAVTAFDDAAGEKFLAAYLVPQDRGLPSVAELRQALAERLPSPMIPSAFVTLQALPLTTSGKVDRRQLPQPAETEREGDRACVAPRTAVEEVLADIWAEVLQRKRVGVTDHFFELGGHSLNALAVVAKVRQALEVELSLSSLVEGPTIAQLAELIEERRSAIWSGDGGNGSSKSAAAAERDAAEIVPHPAARYEPFPLNDIQQAYWIGRSGLVELGQVSTHRYMELDCPDVDLPRLEEAWRRLIDRHDMLRAIVLPDGRQQVQERVEPYVIRVIDARGCDEAAVEAEIAALRGRMSHQVIPSDRWPLFEIAAVRLDERHVRLHMSFDALILDLRSRLILFEEWRQLYHDLDAPLEPLTLTFRDYVLSEESQRASARYQAAERYWRGRLEKLPAHPDLPLAKDPAAIEKPFFVRRAARIDRGTWSRLKARANQSGLTPSGLLLSAFTEVLRLWSRQPRFSLNLTFLDRRPVHPQVEKIVGDFTSLLLLEVDGDASGTFEARSRSLQQQLWRDLDHLAFNGVRVLRELARNQDEGLKAGMPVVFTSALAYDQARSGARLADWLGESAFDISQTPQVWLDHVVLEDAGELSYSWDVIEELFPAGMIDDMFAAYRNLLERLAGDEDAWHLAGSDVAAAVLPESQRQRRLEANATEAPIPEGLLHARFAEQAAMRPDHPAVISAERTLTYGELLAASRRIGRRLRELGARPNRLIAVVMQKGWEQMAAVLGILESGGAYLPVDANLPVERQRQLLEDGQVELVLTQSRFDEQLEWPEGLRRLRVDDPSEWENVSSEPLEAAQGPEDLAYVIYTSGSSGRPKGVVIDHRGALNTVVDVNDRIAMRPNDRVLALSSLSFDLSVYDVFGTLTAGGTIVVPEADAMQNPARWAQLVSEHRVTVWNSVPALMELLVEHLEDQPRLNEPSLRAVMMSGDWIPTTLPARIRDVFGDIRLISMGGATEASIWSIWYEIGEVDPSWKSIPYGKAMLNQSFHVFNERMEPCPVWAPGNLYIGGIGLAKGYWGDAERTAAAFITHPHTGERMYRTGDMGRFLPDGNIEFLGREDFQVKIRGNRIELGEIEAVLAQHPAVKGAVVSAVGPSKTEKKLVAYFVAHEGRTPETDELRSHLQAKLPAYMVPASYMLLDRFPLSSNGKVDRKRLPAPPEVERNAPAGSAASAAQMAQAAASNDDAIIAQAVAGVLGLEQIDPEANLLTLGATSIDMIRIVNAVEKALGFRPQIGDFYRQPTVRALGDAYRQYAAENGLPAASAGAVAPSMPAWEQLRRHGASGVRLITDPLEREEFKRNRPGLRTFEKSNRRISLAGPCAADEAAQKLWLRRRSHRQYAGGRLPAESLGHCLAALREVAINGEPKRRYGSAGGLYPVQTYVYAKPERVEGLPAGVFYHNPAEHELVQIEPGGEIRREIFGEDSNGPIFDEAAIVVFLVAQMKAVVPMYGEESLRYAAIEAGAIAQLLETTGPEHGLGFCQLGSFEFEQIRGALGIDEGHVCIHGLLGGPIDPAIADRWYPFTEDCGILKSETGDAGFEEGAI